MNAAPVLLKIAQALHHCRLEAVLIGNAAAALQGAPVTTLDFDFMFRKTPVNLKKIKKLADILEARVFKPFYPLSDLYRISDDEGSLQLDFMTAIHGIKSFATLRAAATTVDFAGYSLLVADLKDIIKSKSALGRPKDVAVMVVLERTLHEKTRTES